MVGAFMAGAGADPLTAGVVVLVIMGPVSMIWFPEVFAGFTGFVSYGKHIDTESPPWLISIFGWFFLVGLPVILTLL